MKSYFKLEERGSSISTELVAGLTTFLAMAYILPVNSYMLADAGIPLGGVFFATAVAAAIASILMGLLANLPVALAPGMGLNAFFTYFLVLTLGLSWQAALAAVLISGFLFFVISITGLRKRIINAIPVGLKYAVGAGIGFFITFIGLKNAGIVVADPATFVALGDLTQPIVLLAIFGIILVVILHSLGNRFALIISIFVTAIVGLLLGTIFPSLTAQMPSYTASGIDFWGDIGKTFFAAFSGFGELFQHPETFGIIFALLFVDFFDTAGTLMAVGTQAGLIDEDGEIIGSDKALIVDSVGTMTGALLGTSNVTSYIESATGIEQGSRTGLSSVVVGGLFILSLFVFPLLSIVNGVIIGGVAYSPVTAMALVMVGTLMVTQLKDIDWSDKAIVIPAFLTIIMMVLTFSIATGIAVGFVFYPIVMVSQGKAKEVNVVMYVLAALFILGFALGLV
ncbi:MAG: NCS2 family permease [Candidatus Izimaplasma sp.]|nr:NCS2 family permease [Candidatus Izimaplasma bacterium]